ncbi:MAG: HAMP domain-containing histidine kinase, partial [Oscillospiraceae bacterium]|nr:HAMP domain-containing histidine kinase [Oscillospiraceae bacterium]
ERPVPPLAPPSEEMGTALMSIKIALDRVVSRVDADENTQLREFTCVLHHSYYRLKRLNDHLAVAFGGQRELLPSETRVEDLKTLCRDLCDTVNCVVRKDISLVFQAEEGSFLTLMDADGIEALLLNLISNSIAHMPSGGTISMALTRQGNRFVIALRDTGSGIDPAKLSGLAARELTDTTDGIGLGLPFAKHIARQHGGTIIIDATPGQGASMRVSLPQRTPDSLNTPVVRYQGKDMTNILTELSTVLDRSVYDKKFMH